MRSTAIVAAASLTFGLSRACEVLDDVKTTFYGTNDSPGGKVAYDCGDRNYLAQGDGSFSNPLTFGGDSLSYLPCQLIYSPYLRKYLRMEDNCKQCIKDANKGIRHISIWSAQAPDSCENELTPTTWQDVVLDPPADLAVDTSSLYANGKCNKGIAQPDATGACFRVAVKPVKTKKTTTSKAQPTKAVPTKAQPTKKTTNRNTTTQQTKPKQTKTIKA